MTASLTAGAEPAVLGPYLARVLGDEAWSAPDVQLVAGGKSNLTYFVSSSAGTVVLRRPPLGSVLPTAHDMAREHRVLSALYGTPVPVPRTLHFEPDPAVLGAPFYVMERVLGHIVRGPMPPGYADTPAQRRQVAEGLLDVMVALHAVDPSDVGLSDFGRPDGYLERQVRRWTKQWQASKAAEDPELDALAVDLAATIPTSPKAGIVHGDYRIDNTILDPTTPGRVAAVLDWEMSTLGDPITDLGIWLVYWSQADDPDLRKQAMGSVIPPATVAPGFPTRAEVAALYAAKTGADLADLHWYVAFGYWKLAVVVAGIVARHSAGAMLGEGFEGIGERVVPLVRLGRAVLDAGEVD